MIKLLSMVLLNVALAIAIFAPPALAAEPANGAKIFSANCTACHIGGTNVIIAQKTLKQEALEKYLENYNTDSLQAIIYQVQHGKNAMPAFKGRLTDTDIEDVASYVLEQAQQGWLTSKEASEIN